MINPQGTDGKGHRCFQGHLKDEHESNFHEEHAVNVDMEIRQLVVAVSLAERITFSLLKRPGLTNDTSVTQGSLMKQYK